MRHELMRPGDWSLSQTRWSVKVLLSLYEVSMKGLLRAYYQQCQQCGRRRGVDTEEGSHSWILNLFFGPALLQVVVWTLHAVALLSSHILYSFLRRIFCSKNHPFSLPFFCLSVLYPFFTTSFTKSSKPKIFGKSFLKRKNTNIFIFFLLFSFQKRKTQQHSPSPYRVYRQRSFTPQSHSGNTLSGILALRGSYDRRLRIRFVSQGVSCVHSVWPGKFLAFSGVFLYRFSLFHLIFLSKKFWRSGTKL
jgi:hypothetical protein